MIFVPCETNGSSPVQKKAQREDLGTLLISFILLIIEYELTEMARERSRLGHHDLVNKKLEIPKFIRKRDFKGYGESMNWCPGRRDLGKEYETSKNSFLGEILLY